MLDFWWVRQSEVNCVKTTDNTANINHVKYQLTYFSGWSLRHFWWWILSENFHDRNINLPCFFVCVKKFFILNSRILRISLLSKITFLCHPLFYNVKIHFNSEKRIVFVVSLAQERNESQFLWKFHKTFDPDVRPKWIITFAFE